MEFRRTPEGGAWELSREEQATLQARRRGAATPDAELPAPPLNWGAAPGAGDDDRLGPLRLAHAWARSSPRIEIAPQTAAALATHGYTFFSSSDVYVPDALLEPLRRLRAQYRTLQYQAFGGPSHKGFFAARTIHADDCTFAPHECESVNFRRFELALAAATVRALPKYDPAKRYIVAYLLSRHAASADAMPAHHDDVQWLAQFNIDRTPGVQGGAIQLSDDNGTLVEERLLNDPLDGYVLRDDLLRHSVGPLVIPPSSGDHRDVIVLRIAMDPE